MSKRKKRTKKYHPHDFEVVKEENINVSEEERVTYLKRIAKLRPNLNRFRNKQGKTQNSQNLRRGNR